MDKILAIRAGSKVSEIFSQQKFLAIRYIISLCNTYLSLSSALAATTISNQPNVFWFNETDKYIYRSNGTTAEKYFMWNTTDAVITMLGYTKKQCKCNLSCLGT